ncbi:hypothetical protein DE146DRAFT_428840 [Phaeosphaeria sp. MPI-PUGE-AT-0046c]|nr:hypothetical protein DE146DRAFT_428840 [Phaeosphaeria sp. MPI-PUGE-AT-0046c]
MRLPPADVLLSWPTPNYDNPVTRGPALVAINYVLVSITVITVGLRLYTRIVIKRWFGIDDIFIILALIFTIGLTTVVVLANQKYGWDRHVWDIPFSKFEPTSKIAMVAKCVFTGAASFTRLSLHCFYYRLVADTGKSWFKWLIHLNVAYTLAILISFPFIAVFMCSPVKAYWEIRVEAGNCMDEGVATLVCGIINCVADFATTVTPLPLVWSLRMPARQRLAVGFLFGLGIIVTGAGIVRTWYIYRSLFGEYDQTWYAYPLWIAAAIEIDLGVICASAPVLRPLLAKIPFSLSETFSGGFSFKGLGDRPSNPSGPVSTPSSATPALSKRRADDIRAVPELNKDKGKSYEMPAWGDVEQGTTLNDTTRGSTDSEERRNARKSRGEIWRKGSPSGGGATKDDRPCGLTITKTSEVELQVSSTRNSRRFSRSPFARKDRENSNPPLPLEERPFAR